MGLSVLECPDATDLTKLVMVERAPGRLVAKTCSEFGKIVRCVSPSKLSYQMLLHSIIMNSSLLERSIYLGNRLSLSLKLKGSIIAKAFLPRSVSMM